MTGLGIAASDSVYISPAEQRAALKRIVKSKQPLFCGGTKRYAALTFDDGPSLGSPKLIKLLKEERIPATWFDVGKNAEDYRKELRAQAAYGPIGNHTWNHASLSTLSPKDTKTELTDTQDMIKSATGQDWNMMRPPYGARDAQSERVTRKLGYAEILWSSDSQDGLGKSVAEISKLAVGGLGPGAVLLFHDGTNPATITALKKKVIPAIRKRNLTMVTLPELLVLNPPTEAQLDAGGEGCAHTGKVNVSGRYVAGPEGN